MSRRLFAVSVCRNLHFPLQDMALPGVGDDLLPMFRTTDKSRISAAILDGACVSALLWLAIFALLG